jgi:hypothetical protein
MATVRNAVTGPLAQPALTTIDDHPIVRPLAETHRQLRIPRQSCHRFHVKPATDSTAKLPPVPYESCH